MRQRHDHPEVLSLHIEGRAARQVQGAARRSRTAMEDQRVRLQGTRLLGRLHRRVRGCAHKLLQETRAVVRHSIESQMVPQSRRIEDHRRLHGRHEFEAAQAYRRSCRNPPTLSRPEYGQGERQAARQRHPRQRIGDAGPCKPVDRSAGCASRSARQRADGARGNTASGSWRAAARCSTAFPYSCSAWRCR